MALLLEPGLPENIDLHTAARYLGAPEGGDPGTLALLESLAPGLGEMARPRAVWCRLEPEEWPRFVAGEDAEKHLEHCHGALLLAVTLGSRCDDWIRRSRVGDVAQGAAADALASALCDQVCDRAEALLRQQFPGEYLTGRYSPGYGDYPVTFQKAICERLDAARAIGLTVTETSLLLPRKSVTALLGVSHQPVTGWRAGCGHCLLRERCAYRKRGIRCD